MTARNRSKKESPDLLEAADRAAGREETQVVESGDGIAITYFGEKIDTPEQLIASAKIDLRLWEVSKVTINNWGVGGKIKRGQDDAGRWQPEQLWQQALRQIRVELRRRAPRFVQDAIKDLLATWKPSRPSQPQRTQRGRSEAFMLELALHDAHFGKRCWAAQTGGDFDLEIVEADYRAAIDDLAERAKPYNVEKVLGVIGSDFFQVNNWLGTTANGTPVDSVDDRFPKVFQAGVRALEYSIRKFREIADVDFIYLGGNHDRETSWYLSQVLAAIFKGDKHVSIDDAPKDRKYVSYGPALIGFAHGDDIKLDKLPLLMATEAPEQWSAAKHRHWHTGHLHKKAMTRFTVGDTFNGVEVWVLPALSGTDSWHFRKGFVQNVRAAEIYLWSNRSGYAGHLSVEARSTQPNQPAPSIRTSRNPD